VARAVSSRLTIHVPVLNGQTGAFTNAFVAAGSGGLSVPLGVVFGPDGNLYVNTAGGTNTLVLRYNGQTGAFIDAFAAAVNDPTFAFIFVPTPIFGCISLHAEPLVGATVKLNQKGP